MSATRELARVRLLPGRGLAFWVLAMLPCYAFGGPGIAFAAIATLLIMIAARVQAGALARSVPTVRRKLELRLLNGCANDVELRIENRSPRRLRVRVRDDYPTGFRTEHEELACVLEPFARARLRYAIVPERRGGFAFGALHVRIERDGFAGFALGAAIASYAADERVRVYPNLRGPRRFELAARLGALRKVGVHKLPRPGGGGDFEELREYVPGDSFRDVDWKATAKRRRPVTRVHADVQNQQLVLAIDAGRMMATALDRLQKLDHAIHAALLLAHVALRNGDRVGLIVFSDEIVSFIPPRAGQSQYRRILEALAEIEAGSSYVDFRRLCEFVRVNVPRRSLLFVFSDLLDEAQAQPLTKHAAFLTRKHLLLCATMREPAISALAFARATDVESAYTRAAAAVLLADREAEKLAIRRAGVGLIEVDADALALAAVNRYLEVKTRHAL